MQIGEAIKNIEEIFELYETYGKGEYIGEPVSLVEHMWQAAELAKKEGYDEEVILAAFFHDIGHLAIHNSPVELMDGVGVVDHEKIGADYLQEMGFSETICNLIQNHVQAKRYLTYKNYDYYQKLSSASKITLTYQGGVMDEREAEAFEADPFHSVYIKLREWDDKAKEVNVTLPPLEKYRQMALKHLFQQKVAPDKNVFSKYQL